jgi:hypothetical protein
MYLGGFHWKRRVHPLHEFEELLVPVATVTFANYSAGRNVQCGKQ